MAEINQIIEPDSFVHIEEDVKVQNQSNLTIRATESVNKPKRDEGFMIEKMTVLQYTHESLSLWLYNPNTVPITVGYNPAVTITA